MTTNLRDLFIFVRTVSGLSGNGPSVGARSETQENSAGDAAGVCAKELMDGVDIQDSFIINQGENVTSEVSDNNVFIFTNENWGPELDTETGLEVYLYCTELCLLYKEKNDISQPVSFHTNDIYRL